MACSCRLQSSPEYHEWMKKQRYSGHLTLIAMLLIGLALTSTQATWRTSAKDNEIHIAQSSSILATHEMDLSSTEQNASVTPIPATIVCNCPQPDYRATVRLEQEKVRHPVIPLGLKNLARIKQYFITMLSYC